MSHSSPQKQQLHNDNNSSSDVENHSPPQSNNKSNSKQRTACTPSSLLQHSDSDLPQAYITINPEMLNSELWSYRDLQLLCMRLQLGGRGKKQELIDKLLAWHTQQHNAEKQDEGIAGCNFALLDLGYKLPQQNDSSEQQQFDPTSAKKTLKSQQQQHQQSHLSQLTPLVPCSAQRQQRNADGTLRSILSPPFRNAATGKSTNKQVKPASRLAQFAAQIAEEERQHNQSSTKRLSFSVFNGVKLIPPREENSESTSDASSQSDNDDDDERSDDSASQDEDDAINSDEYASGDELHNSDSGSPMQQHSPEQRLQFQRTQHAVIDPDSPSAESIDSYASGDELNADKDEQQQTEDRHSNDSTLDQAETPSQRSPQNNINASRSSTSSEDSARRAMRAAELASVSRLSRALAQTDLQESNHKQKQQQQQQHELQ
jgi:hypothetical protein